MRNYGQFERVVTQQPMHDPRQGTCLLMLAVFLLVATLAMYLVYRIFSESKWAYRFQEPIDIAEARFANGDITKAQLSDIRKELEQ
jgi:uncharacterized membrane protein